MNDDDWKEMLARANNFDWDRYHQYMDIMTSMPMFADWYANRPQSVRNLLETKPFEKFYTSKHSHKEVVRVWGIAEMSDGSLRYHAACAHPFHTNILDALDPDELQVVDKWNEDQLKLIRSNDQPLVFLMPDGWRELALQNTPE